MLNTKVPIIRLVNKSEGVVVLAAETFTEMSHGMPRPVGGAGSTIEA
jgi:hypothetical protein